MKNHIILIVVMLLLTGCADSIPTHTETTTFYKPDGTVSHVTQTEGAPPTTSKAIILEFNQ